MIAETKICTKCKVEKSISEFSKHKECKYGVRSICKACCSEQNKKYENPEKRKLISKKWRENNREKYLMSQRQSSKKRWLNGKVKEYRLENIEKYRSYRQQWRELNKEKENERTNRWRKNNPEQYKISDYKTKCKRRKRNRELFAIYYAANKESMNSIKRYKCEYLHDEYVISTLQKGTNLTAAQIRQIPELIETKRLIIKSKRLCKTLEN